MNAFERRPRAVARHLRQLRRRRGSGVSMPRSYSARAPYKFGGGAIPVTKAIAALLGFCYRKIALTPLYRIAVRVLRLPAPRIAAHLIDRDAGAPAELVGRERRIGEGLRDVALPTRMELQSDCLAARGLEGTRHFKH